MAGEIQTQAATELLTRKPYDDPDAYRRGELAAATDLENQQTRQSMNDSKLLSQIAQQSIDPKSGQLDWNKFQGATASNPALSGPTKLKAIEQAQPLMKQQAMTNALNNYNGNLRDLINDPKNAAVKSDLIKFTSDNMDFFTEHQAERDKYYADLAAKASQAKTPEEKADIINGGRFAAQTRWNPVTVKQDFGQGISNDQWIQQHLKPLTPEEEINQQKNVLTEEQRQSTEDQRSETERHNKVEEAQRWTQLSQEKKKNITDKIGEKTAKRIGDMSKALDPSGLTRGPFSVSKQVLDRSERLKMLDENIKDYQAGNADSRQIEEMAIGLNAELSGANTGAQQQVAALVPKTITGNAAKLKEWLSSNPQGTNQQEFVKRMMMSVTSEGALTSTQIKRTQMQRVAQFDDIKKNAPEEYSNELKSWGIDPKEYEDWKAGGFKPLDVQQMAKDKITKDGGLDVKGGSAKSYSSVDEAEKAGHKPGDKVIINGVTGTLK